MPRMVSVSAVLALLLMSRLLALDQSSKVTGYAIFDGKELIKHGNLTFNNPDLGERLCGLRKKIIEMIEEYQIDEVVFEDIQLQADVGNNVSVFKILAEVFGVVYQLCTEYKIPSRTILATSWRSILKIPGYKRNEQKRNAQEYVNNKYNIKCTQDEADAICIGTAVLGQD